MCYDAGVGFLFFWRKDGFGMEIEIFTAIIGAVAVFATGITAIIVAAWKISGQLSRMDARMDGMEQGMQGMNQHIDALEQRMNQRMDGLERQINDIRADIRSINERLGPIAAA